MRGVSIALICVVMGASACSADSPKVVGLDGSEIAVALRKSDVASVSRSCRRKILATPATTIPGRHPRSAINARDVEHSIDPAERTCVNREAPAKYRADWPKARADAVDKVCADSAAEEVRVTWLDYQGDRFTELLVCPIRAG